VWNVGVRPVGPDPARVEREALRLSTFIAVSRCWEGPWPRVMPVGACGRGGRGQFAKNACTIGDEFAGVLQEGVEVCAGRA